MKHPILTIAGVAFGAVVLASAGNRVDAIAGDGTATQSVRFGTNTAAAYTGELFAIPGAVMREIRPEVQAMSAEAGGLLGTPGATATPAPAPAAPTGDLNGGSGQ